MSISPRLLYRCIVDLSHWQEQKLNFKHAYDDGVEAVILKSTQGLSYVDPTFEKRALDAEKAGLLVGAYHFLDKSNVTKQVAHFLEIAVDPDHPRLLVLDVEPNGDNTVTVAQAASAAEQIEKHAGRKPVIYMGRSGPDGKGGGLPNSYLAECPLWLAAYNGDPVCPVGWEEWVMWQFTDGKYGASVPPVPGIGVCDQSFFAGDGEDLAAFWRDFGGAKPS